MSESEWYEKMAQAIKKREHAYAMRDRWTASIEVAEQEIQALSAEQGRTPE